MNTMVTECAGVEVVTPSNGDQPGTWFSRHVQNVYKAVNDGTLVLTGATRLETSWPTSTGKHTVGTVRNQGESDSAFLARHLSQAATDIDTYPPIP
jgi:hypothetical protein